MTSYFWCVIFVSSSANSYVAAVISSILLCKFSRASATIRRILKQVNFNKYLIFKNSRAKDFSNAKNWVFLKSTDYGLLTKSPVLLPLIQEIVIEVPYDLNLNDFFLLQFVTKSLNEKWHNQYDLLIQISSKSHACWYDTSTYILLRVFR